LGTEDREHSGRPTQVTIPENMDAIHSIILDNRRISQERVNYIIHKIFYMRKLSAKRIKSVSNCLLHKPFWTNFGGILELPHNYG
jgi:hypothetical protein